MNSPLLYVGWNRQRSGYERSWLRQPLSSFDKPPLPGCGHPPVLRTRKLTTTLALGLSRAENTPSEMRALVRTRALDSPMGRERARTGAGDGVPPDRGLWSRDSQTELGTSENGGVTHGIGNSAQGTRSTQGGHQTRRSQANGKQRKEKGRWVGTKPGRDSIVGRAMKVDGKESSEQQRAQPRTGRVKTKTASPQSSFI